MNIIGWIMAWGCIVLCWYALGFLGASLFRLYENYCFGPHTESWRFVRRAAIFGLFGLLVVIGFFSAQFFGPKLDKWFE